MPRKSSISTKAESAGEVIVSYKGLNEQFKCREHQFEVGKTYTVSGKIVACENGFHACENPFDVLGYYDLISSRFAVVEQSGKIARHGEDTKIASATITIKAELSVGEFVRKCVDWIIDATKGRGDDPSGDYAQIGSSGDYAQIGSSGDSARIGSSGDSAQIGSSGDSARIGSSGHSARIGSSGHSARIGSSGDYAQIDSSGEKSVVASAGAATRIKAKAGTHIALAEFKNGECVGFATGCIGRDGLSEDTWYIASNGKLVEDK